MESVVREERCIVKGFVKQVGFKREAKDRGSYG